MEERTKTIFEENQSLIKSLLRPQKGKKNVDEVDRFFSEKINKPIQGTSDIIKNPNVRPPTMLKEREVISWVEKLFELSQIALKTDNIYVLQSALKNIYSSFLPNGIEFEITDERAQGLGVFGDVNLKSNLVKAISIPLSEQSLLRDVYLTENLYKGPLLPSHWNTLLSNKLMGGKVCPEVLALPIFDENGVSSIILSCSIPENFSDVKTILVGTLLSQVKAAISK